MTVTLIWYAGKCALCISELIFHRWSDDALELFSRSRHESLPVWACFFLVYLKQHRRFFHGRMFSSSASSAWSVDYMGWKWWYCLWACCSTASDSFGGTGDDCFTIRGTYWSAERGFLYPVIKIFTKGKQKGQIRGKQLLVRSSRTEWLVFALLGPFLSSGPFLWQSLWSLSTRLYSTTCYIRNAPISRSRAH